MTITIRDAAPADAPTIAAFVRELAEYERLAHEVTATEADYAEALFGPAPSVHCDLAVDAADGGAPVGFALWFKNYSTFAGRHGIYLEDLYVRPSHRGRGVGKALLARLARRCADNGWSRLQWSVLDWNAPSIAFYRSLGAALMDEWTVCRVDGEALARLAEGARASSRAIASGPPGR